MIEVLATLTKGITQYDGRLNNTPIVPNTVQMTIRNPTITAVDDGRGNILGKGIWGRIEYKSGKYEVNIILETVEGRTLSVEYSYGVI